MAGQQLAQLVVGVVLAAFQNLHGGHDEARRAEAALNGRFLDKGLLNVGQFAVGAGETFQGADVLALGPDGQIDAGVEGFPVDDHVAGAALAHLTALFDRVQGEVVAEHIGQRCPDVDVFFHILPVEVEVNGLILGDMLFHYSAPPHSFTDSIKARLALSTAMCIRKSLAARQESRG